MKVSKIACQILFLVSLFTVTNFHSANAYADDNGINPVVICEYQDSSMNYVTDSVAFGNSIYCEAPVRISCIGNVDYDEEKYTSCLCEWKIYETDKGSSNPIIDRFEEDTEYTISTTGSYGIIFYYTLRDKKGVDYPYQTDSAVVTIKESELECPDGFSPNGDGINDRFKMTKFQSIVELDGEIYNRWGQKLHTFTLDNIREGWDGYYNGKIIKDGGYLLRIHARGSEGYEYNIKKVINVLKGFKEQSE